MDFYHVLNRGVEKRDIVLSDDDRMRFVRSLYLFNDSHPAPNAISQPTAVNTTSKGRDLLVYIHAWCLMNNHYHLLLSPLNDNTENLSLFLKKLNGGYAKFFNDKYERTGSLWQGKTKKILISQENHFNYLPYYIHLNPLDYAHPGWRSGDLQTTDMFLQALDNYRWSSYLDYSGKQNFPSVLNKEILTDILDSKSQQEKIIKNIVTNLGRRTS